MNRRDRKVFEAKFWHVIRVNTAFKRTRATRAIKNPRLRMCILDIAPLLISHLKFYKVHTLTFQSHLKDFNTGRRNPRNRCIRTSKPLTIRNSLLELPNMSERGSLGLWRWLSDNQQFRFLANSFLFFLDLLDVKDFFSKFPSLEEVPLIVDDGEIGVETGFQETLLIGDAEEFCGVGGDALNSLRDRARSPRDEIADARIKCHGTEISIQNSGGIYLPAIVSSPSRCNLIPSLVILFPFVQSYVPFGNPSCAIASVTKIAPFG
jgi:hypothetical protein